MGVVGKELSQARRIVSLEVHKHLERTIRVGRQTQVHRIEDIVETGVGQRLQFLDRRSDIGEADPHEVGAQTRPAWTHSDRYRSSSNRVTCFL